MRPLWIRVLHVATAVLWLVIGVDGLRRGDAGFIPIVATLSGVLGLIAAWLDRQRSARQRHG